MKTLLFYLWTHKSVRRGNKGNENVSSLCALVSILPITINFEIFYQNLARNRVLDHAGAVIVMMITMILKTQVSVD